MHRLENLLHLRNVCDPLQIKTIFLEKIKHQISLTSWTLFAFLFVFSIQLIVNKIAGVWIQTADL